MKPDTSIDGENEPTRRQTLQATLGGAAALTVGAGVAAGEEDVCEVPEGERQAVREEHADSDQLVAALEGAEAVRDAVNDTGLVEGETVAALVYAPVEDCEAVPEYRVFRETARGSYLTVSVRPGSGAAYAMNRPHEPDDENFPCDHVTGDCSPSCYDDRCCGCYVGYCGCEGSRIPCDTFCCAKCDCDCDRGWRRCREHCVEYVTEPLVVDLSEGAWQAAMA